ncbi:MAG: UDP-N-acetylmuramate--L-alanine ligase [Clostridia bacterium]|nr:UDP-N-acetylmuramate--L-alanine ligase [Clostridia bacterium]
MIGIGGSGMCPIAEILHAKGYQLTGSDNNEGDPLKRIRALGIPVVMGHKAENVHGAELVIYSAAIHSDNPEIVEAKRLQIPVIERSHILGMITRKFDKVIGVCGTHGKTTVSSMITQILIQNNYNPTAVIGGRLPLINANGLAGESEYMVCESCEFVDTFLQLSPDMAVLLNIDNDHLDYFKTMENLCASFRKFVDMAPVAVVNGDDALVLQALNGYSGKQITFGLKESNDYYAKEVKDTACGKTFMLSHRGEPVTEIRLNVPGAHNIYNALAAFAAAEYYGVTASGIRDSLAQFGGAGRRFERLGSFNGIDLADDYAHHPTEIKATLTAAKQLGYTNVIAVFQPFTFSRTALLKEEFIEALSIADKVILTEIMGSREVNESGITSADLAAGLKDCVCVKNFDEIAAHILQIAHSGDLIITMGGGDIYKAAVKIREALEK